MSGLIPTTFFDGIEKLCVPDLNFDHKVSEAGHVAGGTAARVLFRN
jgi:hypothetical protein